jgi:hypothetical protein
MKNKMNKTVSAKAVNPTLTKSQWQIVREQLNYYLAFNRSLKKAKSPWKKFEFLKSAKVIERAIVRQFGQWSITTNGNHKPMCFDVNGTRYGWNAYDFTRL